MKYEISYQVRNIIVQSFSGFIAGSGIPVRDMAARKALAARSERAVRSGMPQARQSDH